MARPIGLGCKQQKCKHRQTLRLGLLESQAQKGQEPRESTADQVGPGAAPICHLTLPGLSVQVSTAPESFRDCLQIQAPRGPEGRTEEQKGRFFPVGTVWGLGSSQKAEVHYCSIKTWVSKYFSIGWEKVLTALRIYFCIVFCFRWH